MTNKRIFITGGAGFLGTNIIRRYHNDNEITIFKSVGLGIQDLAISELVLDRLNS